MAVSATLSAVDADSLRACVADGGVAVFPTDTVYGVCCDPDDHAAAARLYGLKGRSSVQPSAVMFFSLKAALATLPELNEAELGALNALLPGPVTVLLENRRTRFAAACRSDPATFGLRVPWLPEPLHALGAIDAPLMQSSANISGQPTRVRSTPCPRACAMASTWCSTAACCRASPRQSSTCASTRRPAHGTCCAKAHLPPRRSASCWRRRADRCAVRPC